MTRRTLSAALFNLRKELLGSFIGDEIVVITGKYRNRFNLFRVGNFGSRVVASSQMIGGSTSNEFGKIEISIELKETFVTFACKDEQCSCFSRDLKGNVQVLTSTDSVFTFPSASKPVTLTSPPP